MDSLLQLDNDYDNRQRPDQVTLGDILRRECRDRKYPFEMSDLNAKGWGDTMWIGGVNGCYSGEIKGAAEIVGGLDKLEAQLLKQVPNCDHCFVGIYGRVEEAIDGNTLVYVRQGPDRLVRDNHPDSIVSRTYKVRYFKQNYLGYRAKLARFYSEFGIEVYELPDLESLAQQILALYSISNTEGRTFSRLIQEKFYINETDQKRRDFMLTLMGIANAGIQEETADAIASFIEESGHQLRMVDFMAYFTELENPATSALSRQPTRNSLKPGARKRTVGPAKVTQIMKAIGL